MTIPLVDNPPVPEYAALVELLSTSNLASIGMVNFATINATLYHNAVGSYTILAPYTDALWAQVMSGNFIVRVKWRGLFSFGGKCETPTFSDSIPGATSGGGSSGSHSGPFITLAGADYLALIANRICYPNPTVAWSGQHQGDQDIVSAPLESAIKWYVNRNIGNSTMTIGGNSCPPAIAARQHPLIDIAADQHRGPQVNYSVNWSQGQSVNLFDVIRSLVAQANPNGTPAQNMGISLIQNPANMGRLLFDVYYPRDLSKVATFSEELGNLTSVSISLTDPTCTDALVQGSASFVSLPSAPGTTPWNKVEQYVDDTSETAASNLTTTAANTLFTGSVGPNLATTITDSPYLVYGRDYRVGDIVAVEIATGDVFSDIISSAAFTADATQTPVMGVVPVIGNAVDPTSANKTIEGNLVNRIKALEKKLATQGR
jgi:hypothetical protein